ncbi:glycosyltransferase [Methylobacterium oryzae]|uniref:glycosyltransferase n=1 Tax=Methylobacterium oryzae TaxID=334852 RepID=UPI002F323BAD
MPDTHHLSDALRDVDAVWYLSRYPDVAAAAQDPAAHYMSHGRAEGRFPNAAAEEAASLRAQVDPVWYRARYPDVAASDMDPADHYLSYGRAEGRFPDAVAEEIAVLRAEVDSIWYRERYPDVGAGDMDPADHYLSYGRAEGRFPNAATEEIAMLRAKVDPVWYRQRYTGEIDLALDPIDHYILRGRFDGHFPNEEAELRRLLAQRVDAAWYLRRYPDIANAGSDPVEHYLNFGMLEDRAPNALAEEYRYEPQTIFDALIRKIFLATTGRDATGPERKAWYRKLKLGLDYSSIQAGLEGSRDLAGQAEKAPPSEIPDGMVAMSEAEFHDYLLMFHDRFLGRAPRADEYLKYTVLKEQGSRLSEILKTIEFGEEAQKLRFRPDLVLLSDGNFVQILFEIAFGRGANPREVEHYVNALTQKTATRKDLIESFFNYAAVEKLNPTRAQFGLAQAHVAHLYGEKDNLTIDRWRERRDRLRDDLKADFDKTRRHPRLMYSRSAKPEVSIITSMYKGAKYIKNFMDNITSQTIFEDCELIIVDAASPEDEISIIRPYQDKHANIHYHRIDYRIGIYDAWNYAIERSTGRFLTNANLDDCRSGESLEIQAAMLQTLPFVDVVYQDVFYSMERDLSFDEIRRCGFATNLPLVSRYNLLEFNSPHNAPMWRRNIHDELGLFDTNYKSAGDYEFWMRCQVAGKTFFKSNVPHVAYYVNPEGLSTRPDTRGIAEANDITKRYCRALVSEHLTSTETDFSRSIPGYDAEKDGGKSRYEVAQSCLRRLASAP